MSLTLPSVQKAWLIENSGTPETALNFRHDWPVPVPKQGEVLVKVHAVALNPVGYKLMALPNFVARNRPIPTEHDFSGVVVNSDGSIFKGGDEVFGWTWKGAMAEYISVPEKQMAVRPANIDTVDAAGISMVGQTALNHLINGGSTSVGAYAIQAAKAKGCTVWASASGKNEGFVRGLGADEFVDYTTEPLQNQLANHPLNPRFHAFIDAAALSDRGLYKHSPKYMDSNGIFVTTGIYPHSVTPGELWNTTKYLASLRSCWIGGVPMKFKFMVGDMLDMKKQEELVSLISEGKVKPLTDSVFALHDALQAYERMMSNRARGKVIVKVASD
ncbi:chaperonin 10-like protein [Flagelloscypha sp. PMI_526]|nr:chaperonin 10-like protein [Flagelloscypha sp. PMI_526]